MRSSKYSIAQKASRREDKKKYWNWSVWVEATDDDLDDIDHVLYILHSTFKHPYREVYERETNFKLDSSGWGVFNIKIKIYLKNGDTVKLDHGLRFEEDAVQKDEDEFESFEREKPVSIYLSYGDDDVEKVQPLIHELQNRNMVVRTKEDEEAYSSNSVFDTAKKNIEASDIFLSLDDEDSRFKKFEQKTAESKKKPVMKFDSKNISRSINQLDDMKNEIGNLE